MEEISYSEEGRGEGFSRENQEDKGAFGMSAKQRTVFGEQDEHSGGSHVEWQLRMTRRQIVMEPVDSRSQTMKLWSLGVMTDDLAPWYPESGPKGAHSLGWLCPDSFSGPDLRTSPHSCLLRERSGNTPSVNPGEAPQEWPPSQGAEAKDVNAEQPGLHHTTIKHGQSTVQTFPNSFKTSAA